MMQPGEDRSRATLGGYWPHALALAPFVFLLVVVFSFAVDVPFYDHWDFVPFLSRSFEGELSFGDFWAQHNEHRLIFPRLIMLALARASAWNVGYEIAASVAFAAATLLLLLRRLAMTGREAGLSLRWLIPVVSLIVFSVGQWENWLWGWQVQIFINVWAAVAGVYVLTAGSLSPLRLAGGAGLGVVATYSFGSGAAFWVAGAFVVHSVIEDRRRRWKYLAAWSAVTAAVMASYLYGYETPPWHPSLWYSLQHPLTFARHVLNYLGGPVAGSSALLAAPAGLLGLLAQAALVVWLAPLGLRRLIPYLALGLYALTSAVITGIGRAGMGSDQALASRYVTVGQLLWISVAACAVLIAARAPRNPEDREGRLAKRGAVAVTALIVAAVAVTSLAGIRPAADRHRHLTRCRSLIEEYPRGGAEAARVLDSIHPTPRLIPRDINTLQRLRLSVFRETDD